MLLLLLLVSLSICVRVTISLTLFRARFQHTLENNYQNGEVKLTMRHLRLTTMYNTFDGSK